MYQAQQITQEIKRVAARRKKLIIFTPLLMVMLSVAALYYIEPEYRSSTTILVQKDEALNPLILYDMTDPRDTEDRLETFNEIIYSRSAVEMLIDSLNLDPEGKHKRRSRQQFVESVRSKISTTNNSSDSFEIIFHSTDPQKAKEGAELLASHFIDSRVNLENRRNTETVNFLQSKVEDLEQFVRMSREEMLAESQSRLQDVPLDVGGIQTELRDIERSLDETEWNLVQLEEDLALINDFLESDQGERQFQRLFNLPMEDIPYGDELGEQLEEYEELRQSYTHSFPQVQRLTEQIIETTQRIPSALETRIQRHEQRRERLVNNRNDKLNKLEQAYIADRQEETARSDYSVYESLFNEMTTALEQAKISRDLGERSGENFVVLDAAIVPDEPHSPNKRLIVALGLIAGIVLGIFLAALAEALDTTVRSIEKVRYHKPIVAYISYE